MKTYLYEEELLRNCKFVSFSGFDLPLYYTSILEEYKTVREKSGLFDISHMGVIEIEGEGTIPFLNFLSFRKLSDKPFGKAVYTGFCNELGNTIDDLLIYLIGKARAYLVVNASNRKAVLNHLLSIAPRYTVKIIPRYETHGILSIQGPLSTKVLSHHFSRIERLKKNDFIYENNVFISYTGYTGEVGYELILKNEDLIPTWNALLSDKEELLKPCGLGARDLLRLEMGYALYGHELSLTISPIESVAKWAVDLDHEFLGKKAIDKLLQEKKNRHAVALIGSEAIPAREGYSVYHEKTLIGKVTSGTFSPYLKQPIALALLDKQFEENALLEIEIRNKLYPFKTTKLPFYKRSL